MHKILYFLFLLCFLFASTTWAKAKEPKIVVEQPKYNFNQVYAGEPVVHTFQFRNSGTAPLTIDKVNHSCGCTASLLSATVLEPGESGEIRSTFDSTRFHGPVVKTVYLYSNDPNRRVVQLYLRGIVKREIAQRPNRISLGNLEPEVTIRSEVTLINQGHNNVLLGEPQTTTPELRASLSSHEIPPGQTTKVIVLTTPKDGKRRLGGYIIIALEGSHIQEIRIPVYAGIKQTVPAKP